MKFMSRQRAEKLAQLLKEEISRIFREELDDPRVGFTTITRVQVTNNLQHATVFVSIFGDEEEKETSIKAIKEAKGFIKNIISDVIYLRFMPDITFKLDESPEYSVYIDRKIDEVRQNDEQE